MYCRVYLIFTIIILFSQAAVFFGYRSPFTISTIDSAQQYRIWTMQDNNNKKKWGRKLQKREIVRERAEKRRKKHWTTAFDRCNCNSNFIIFSVVVWFCVYLVDVCCSANKLFRTVWDDDDDDHSGDDRRSLCNIGDVMRVHEWNGWRKSSDAK